MPLTFHYGTMNCGKTTRLLVARHSYAQHGKAPGLLKPAVDTRAGDPGRVSCRVPGLEREADLVVHADDVLDEAALVRRFHVLLLDECHFFSPAQIEALHRVSLAIPVHAYGLRTDFRGRLFPGAQRLLELCDAAPEVASLCSTPACLAPAKFNLRVDADGRALFEGPEIEIGAEERYRAVCKACWLSEQPSQ